MKDDNKSSAWSILATGLAFMFIFLGIGGCVYLIDKGAAERQRQKQEQNHKSRE